MSAFSERQWGNSSLSYASQNIAMNYVPPPGWVSKGMIDSGKYIELAKALTPDLADAIISDDGVLKFKGIAFGNDKYYVAETSPLGEVFFATKDLTTIVHLPRTPCRHSYCLWASQRFCEQCGCKSK